MKSSKVAAAAAVAALLSLPIETQAMEVIGGSGLVAADDMVQTVQYRGHPHAHPGYRPGVHPGYRPGYRPGGPGYHPGYRPGAPGYRPGVVAPRGVWVGRPGWYRWAPGGAIAAGAAIGFVTAAAAAAYASAPPQPGLCWYYTDPSRTQGFWDACP